MMGNGSGSGWQNHWLALVLILGVVGALIYFGITSDREDPEDTKAPSKPATKAPSKPATKAPSKPSTPKPTTRAPTPATKAPAPPTNKQTNRKGRERKKGKKEKFVVMFMPTVAPTALDNAPV